MKQVLVDTSLWYAYINTSDRDHAKAQRLVKKYGGRLVTSNYIFDETVTLCLYDFGHSVARQVGSVLLNPVAVNLIRVSSEDEVAAWELFLKRPDKTYSFTDCTSFILMKRLGIRQAASLDADFAREGFEVLT
jgi:uncharacterized protein